jgi:small subunit ribosomal protein S6
MAETIDTNARKPREYETIYILDPKVDPDEADRIASRMTDVVSRMGGKLTKLDNWGKRKLAYQIRRNTRGVFVHMKYVGLGDIVAEVERNLRMLDAVMRHQSVLLRSEGITLDVAVDPEDEPEPNLEERLGMIEREQSRPKPEGDLDEYGDEGMDDDVGDDKE